MNQPTTITATLPAWLTTASDAQRFLRDVTDRKERAAVSQLYFCGGDMSKGDNPWTLVGQAFISVELLPADAMLASQLKSLQAELDAARAEWLTKQQKIMEQITKLQALPNEVHVVNEAEPVPMAGMTGCGFNDVLEVTKRDWAK